MRRLQQPRKIKMFKMCDNPILFRGLPKKGVVAAQKDLLPHGRVRRECPRDHFQRPQFRSQIAYEALQLKCLFCERVLIALGLILTDFHSLFEHFRNSLSKEDQCECPLV